MAASRWWTRRSTVAWRRWRTNNRRVNICDLYIKFPHHLDVDTQGSNHMESPQIAWTDSATTKQVRQPCGAFSFTILFFYS